MRSREIIQQKQYPQGLGRYILWRTGGNITYDIQGSREINHQQCCTNCRHIKCTQNETLKIVTGCHKMSSVDHLHVKAEMLKVREHSYYYLHSIWLDVWNQKMSATLYHHTETDEGDTIHQTSQHVRTNTMIIGKQYSKQFTLTQSKRRGKEHSVR